VQAKLTIIGEGILEQSIKALVAELHLTDKIIFTGLIPNNQLPEFYHKADILLHTSLSEGQSEVVTEAMCCGILVAGTQVGLLYDLQNCCIPVKIEDDYSLAQAVLSIVRDKVKMKEIRERAHSWANAHSIQWTLERIKELYKT